jgi:muramidase (phage lysozyme)
MVWHDLRCRAILKQSPHDSRVFRRDARPIRERARDPRVAALAGTVRGSWPTS